VLESRQVPAQRPAIAAVPHLSVVAS
jgi:hypothetical protein